MNELRTSKFQLCTDYKGVFRDIRVIQRQQTNSKQICHRNENDENYFMCMCGRVRSVTLKILIYANALNYEFVVLFGAMGQRECDDNPDARVDESNDNDNNK